MQFGDILCLKTTGELTFILEVLEIEGQKTVVDVRRPILGREGITHQIDRFFAEELETPEQHLRHEAQEMLLKAKIQQDFFKEAQEEDKAEVAKKVTDIAVN